MSDGTRCTQSTEEQSAIPLNESRKMQATKSLRYLRLILILFIDISIHLRIYIEFNKTRYRVRHRIENQRQILKVKLF